MEIKNVYNLVTTLPIRQKILFIILICFLVSAIFPHYTLISIVPFIASLFFLPGYLITCLIFPEDELPQIIRYILFFVFSVVVLASVAILLTALKIPLFNPDFSLISPVFLGVMFLSVCALVLGELRRFTSIISSPPIPASGEKNLSVIPYLKNVSHSIDKLSICLLVLIISLLIGGHFICTTNQYAPVTEFYLLTNEGKIIDYPLTISYNETPSVLVGIVNNEHTHMDYILIITQDNTTLSSQNISLNDNEIWLERQSLPMVANPNPEKQKNEFKLYKKDDITEPYRRLHIWIINK